MRKSHCGYSPFDVETKSYSGNEKKADENDYVCVSADIANRIAKRKSLMRDLQMSFHKDDISFYYTYSCGCYRCDEEGEEPYFVERNVLMRVDKTGRLSEFKQIATNHWAFVEVQASFGRIRTSTAFDVIRERLVANGLIDLLDDRNIFDEKAIYLRGDWHRIFRLTAQCELEAFSSQKGRKVGI